MNPYEAPNSKPRTAKRLVWISLAITSLALFGIATILVLGIWASREARMDRGGNLRQLRLAIKEYETSMGRLESPSTEQTAKTIENR